MPAGHELLTTSLVAALFAIPVQPAAADACALSWVRQPGSEHCASGPELAAAVEAYVDKPVLVALSRAQLTVEGTIASTAPGFEVRLRLVDRAGVVKGERAIASRSDTCRDLDPLLVFLIALMIDPDAPLLPPELPSGLTGETEHMLADLFGSEPTVPPLALATPAPPAPQRAARAPAPKDTTPTASEAAGSREVSAWHVGAQLDALGALGQLPSTALAGRVLLRAVHIDTWSIGLGAQLFAPNRLSGDPAQFSLFLAEFELGLRMFRFADSLALWARAGATTGPMHSQVLTAGGRDPTRLALQAGVGSELVWTLGPRMSLQVGLTLQLPFIRDRFYWNDATGHQEVFRMSPLFATAHVGGALEIL